MMRMAISYGATGKRNSAIAGAADAKRAATAAIRFVIFIPGRSRFSA
jgi:hypothetical protein